MGTHTTWFDHLRSRITGHSASVYATRRAARADLHALEARRAQAAARLNEDIELIDRYVNPLERYMDGDRLLTPLGTILDRRSGKNLPLVWTELDLREFRRWSRVLCDINPFAVGFLGLLIDFHIRQGFGWQVVSRDYSPPRTQSTQRKNQREEETNPPSYSATSASSAVNNSSIAAIRACQVVLDEWRDQEQWALKSREAFRRWRRDGEIFLRFFRGDAETRGLPVIRFVEPEQVGPPPGDDADGRWSFGILTDPEDVESVYAYFVRDPLGTGSEGDEVPAERILHLKANVDTSIKRGLPDFVPVQDDLERVRRMLRNMGEVAAIQTAIAWVSQYATATVDQVGTLIRAGSDYTRPKIGDPSGKLMDVVNYEPGTVIHMDSNRQFLAGPVGTGTAGFIQVEQAILRGCGARWRFPEYFSGDASNNNMASSIVAGSPFVVAVEGNQLEWGVFERAVAKKVLELSVESGRLSREQVAHVDVKVTPPSVALANREEEERLRQMRHQAGVLSVTTWQQQVGLDPKHEAANFAAEAKRKAGPQGKGDGGELPRMTQEDDQSLEWESPLWESESEPKVKAWKRINGRIYVKNVTQNAITNLGWMEGEPPKKDDGENKDKPSGSKEPTEAPSTGGEKKNIAAGDDKSKSSDADQKTTKGSTVAPTPPHKPDGGPPHNADEPGTGEKSSSHAQLLLHSVPEAFKESRRRLDAALTEREDAHKALKKIREQSATDKSARSAAEDRFKHAVSVANNAKAAHMAISRAHLLATLGTQNNPAVPASIRDPKLAEAIQLVVDEAMSFLGKLQTTSPPAGAVSIWKCTRGREEYEAKRKRMLLLLNSDTESVIHEYGHHLETNKGILAVANRFWTSHFNGQPEINLQKEFPAGSYSQGEIGREDKTGQIQKLALLGFLWVVLATRCPFGPWFSCSRASFLDSANQ